MSAISREAAALIRTNRWAAMATLDAGEPLASMVAYALEPGGGALLFHVSQLAQHTRDLVEHPRGALAISEPDTLEGDPQRLQRVTVTGTASVLRRGDPTYLPAAEASIGQEHAEAAKKGCPVSKALAGVEIGLTARLASA